MNIDAAANSYFRPSFRPYLPQNVPAEAVALSHEELEKTRRNPADRALVVKTNKEATVPVGLRKEDGAALSSSFQDRHNEQHPSEEAPGISLEYMSRMRNWDHRLIAWFKTAFDVQENPAKNRGSLINIVI